MTRDEAKALLLNISAYDIDTQRGMKKQEAIEMAIKALEQEPCDDCISRQAVIEYIEGSEAELGHSSENELVCRDIKALPPVTPQQKMGRWIVQPSNEEQGERPFIWWKCSNCGHVIYSESTHDRLEFHAFCSRCGAKMVESEVSE